MVFAKKRLNPIRIRTDVTREDLEELERHEKRTKRRPQELLLKDVLVADQVFQWRGEDIIRRDEHVRTLSRALLDQGKPLDPILVTPIGTKFYLVDGHHRLEAYHTAQWKRKVPVRYFEGGLKAARQRALQSNIKDKLPMRPEEKSEAAWQMVLEDIAGSERAGVVAGAVWTRDVITTATAVSERTVNNMRAVARKDPTARTRNWREARRSQWEVTRMKADDSWLDEKAANMAAQMGKNCGPLFKNAEVVAKALEFVSPELVDGLLYQWWERALGMVISQMKERAEELRDPALGKQFEEAVEGLFKTLDALDLRAWDL